MVRVVRFAAFGLSVAILIGLLAVAGFVMATRPTPMSLEALNAKLSPGSSRTARAPSPWWSCTMAAAG